MKRHISVFIIFAFIIICLSGCMVYRDDVLVSIGKYSSSEFYSSGEFQDYTDYAKYIYESVDLSNNAYFVQISDSNLKSLETHISNFEDWVDSIGFSIPDDELYVNYDFDSSIISSDDYVYIYDDPDAPRLSNYDIYFFDTETNVLYYFHSNT